MIKFFRTIRQNLLNEGKTSRYLKYAIGEIILVVIGILIALQINNWNIKRLNLEKETKYLKEINNNLKSDILSIQKVLDFNQKKETFIFECFDLLDIKNTYNGPEIFWPRLTTIGSYDHFAPNNLGFKNLMSAENIGLIDNDTLRKNLLEYYNFDFATGTQKRVEEVTRKFIDYILPLITTKESISNLYNVELNLHQNHDVEINSDPKIISYLNLIHVATRFQNELLKGKKRKIELLIENVQNELNVEL